MEMQQRMQREVCPLIARVCCVFEQAVHIPLQRVYIYFCFVPKFGTSRTGVRQELVLMRACRPYCFVFL